jgi:tocopherol O-methyltransferase
VIVPRSIATPQDVAEHYDVLDPFYRSLWGEHLHHGLWQTGEETPEEAVQNLVALVASRLGLGSLDHVCDVGCGYGATARFLTRRYGALVTGVTLSAAQLAYAATQSGPGGPFLQRMDWLENRFADAAFDHVLAIESTEHMADLRRFFAEAFRTLRPGGRIAVCAWLAGPDPSSWEVRHLLEPICREGRLVAMGTAAEYRALMREVGFVEIGEEELSRAVRRTWTLSIRRTLHALLTQPEARRFLRDKRHADRVFALTLFRLWLAYRTGAMRYGLFTARKPGPS